MGSLNCSKFKAEEKQIPHPYAPRPYCSVVIKSSTWTKDISNLFDYENHDLVRKNIKVAGSCKFIRRK